MNTKEGRKLLATLLDFGNIKPSYHRMFTDKLADPTTRRVSSYVSGRATRLQINSLIQSLRYAGATDVVFTTPNGYALYPSRCGNHIRMTCKWEG